MTSVRLFSQILLLGMLSYCMPSIAGAANAAPFYLLDWKEPFPQPALLTAADTTAIRTGLKEASIKNDQTCSLSKPVIASTVLPINAHASSICVGRDREIIWSESTQGLYFCKQGNTVKAMRTSIGSNGLGKATEGDRKTPIGSYWLGAPRKSDRYGLFIPVGYPNEVDKQAGRTGNSVGIHGPLRLPLFASACSVRDSLAKNWTAGCISVARDTQISEIADWVVENWPVQLHILADKKSE